MPHEPIIPTRSAAQIKADLDAEFSAWIDARTAELVSRGVNAADAHAQALADFGDAGAARQYCATQDAAVDQRIRWRFRVEELVSDIRIAMRTLRRTPTFAAVVLLTFAIGIGATTAVFSAVHAVLLRPLPYSDESALVVLHATDHGALAIGGQLSAGTVGALRERTTSFTGISAISPATYSIITNDEPEAIQGGRVTAETFSVLGARPAHGRTFMAGDDSAGAPPTVILSDALWRRRFGGDTAVVGTMIDVSGVQRQVVGIMPPDFKLPTYELSELWAPLPLAAAMRDPIRSHKFRFLRVVTRRKALVSSAVAQADVDRTLHELFTEMPDAYEHFGVRVVDMRDEVVGSVATRLWVLLGAAALVLLIACANIGGLLLSRAAARQHELSIRVALGAGRARLARQFLAEGLVLTVSGGTLGIGVAAVGIAGLRAIAVNALPPGTSLSLEPRVLVFALATAAIGGLFFSVVPALAATQPPAANLGGDGTRGAQQHVRARLRMALIVGQLAVTVTLLVGAGLMVRTLANLFERDLGYRTTNVLSFFVSLPATRYKDNPSEDRFWDALFTRIGGTPGVVAVGAAGNIPLGGSSSSGMVIEGRPDMVGHAVDVRYLNASASYFSVLDIPVTQGRTFTSDDRDGGPGSVLASVSLAKRFWPGANPVGARIRLGPDPAAPWQTIVGVVGDVRPGVDQDALATVYASQTQDHWRSGTVVVRATGDAAALAGAVRSAVHAVDPLMPVMQLITVDALRSRALSGRRLPMELMLVFGAVALLLSSVGVYGVCAYAVESRRREFGIRLALGATRGRVLGGALRDALIATSLGLAIGLPLAWAGARQLRSLLYGVAPTDVTTFAIALGVLVVVVAVASFIPARRATRVDPLVAMRAE